MGKKVQSTLEANLFALELQLGDIGPGAFAVLAQRHVEVQDDVHFRTGAARARERQSATAEGISLLFEQEQPNPVLSRCRNRATR